MAKKMMAVFLVCILVVASVQLSTANMLGDVEAKFKSMFGGSSDSEAKFKSCHETCLKECLAQGKDATTCGSKCDGDCAKNAEAPAPQSAAAPINN